MRILWLSANLLLPLDKGGKLRTWHVMRHLAARHSITYLSFADPETAAEDLEGMAEVCARLVTIPRRERTKSGPRFALDVMRHLVNPVPFAVGQYRSSRFARTVRDELASGSYDRVVCDFLVPAVNMPRRLPCPSLLFTHNVEAEIWRRHADTARSWLRRRLYQQQWRRMQRFENQTLSAFDRVLAVSDLDRQTFHRLYPESRKTPISVIPTGVDTEYFTPTPAAPGATPRIVFTGSMDWLPNVDGVLYFVREILPLIRAEAPDVVFTIVGRSPTAEVLELASQPGHRGDGPRRGRQAVPGGVDGQRRSVAYRRRHAAEDFRSHGRRTRRRLDHYRRGGPAGRTRSAPHARRRSARVRAIGRGAPARP